MKIAIVTPRYGANVAGGAERLAREYATRLSTTMDVTVLTTCAQDYTTWADAFEPGVSRDEDVTVRRFTVPTPRDPDRFNELCRAVLQNRSSADEEAWMDAQGPNAPELLEHLSRSGGDYDAVIFVPYLYATTVRGLPLVGDRAVLVPALHDEPWLALSIFDDVVARSRALVFSTPEERDLAASRFAVSLAHSAVIGAGVDPPALDPRAQPIIDDASRPYVVCVGRIDPSKGSDALIRAHRSLVAHLPSAPELVLLGPAAMQLPDELWLHAPGFVSEEVKTATIAHAQALVCPSSFESLSLVLLEAWALGVPTLSTADSSVLVGQSRRSGAGLWYRDDDEYSEAVRLLIDTPALASALGDAGRRFTATLSWTLITERLTTVLRDVAGRLPPSSPNR